MGCIIKFIYNVLLKTVIPPTDEEKYALTIISGVNFNHQASMYPNVPPCVTINEMLSSWRLFKTEMDCERLVIQEYHQSHRKV